MSFDAGKISRFSIVVSVNDGFDRRRRLGSYRFFEMQARREIRLLALPLGIGLRIDIGRCRADRCPGESMGLAEQATSGSMGDG